MEPNTVYTANGWTSEGRAIYSKDDKEPFWTLVAKVSTEVPEGEMIGVIELLRAAPETARKLAEAEARNAELVAVLRGCNEWFTLHHSTANIRKPGGNPTPAVMTIRDAIAHAESQQSHTI